jgi:predicted MFS family arabinose efflux permease
VSGERHLVASFALATFATIYSAVVIAPLVTQISADFGVTAGTVGLVAAAYAIPGVFVGALAGPFADRHGRRLPLVAGTILLGSSTIASAFAPDLVMLGALRVVAGVGAAVILPNMMAALADHFEQPRRSRMIALIFMANTTGSLAGIALAGIVAERFGWRVSLALAGAIAIVAAATLLRAPIRRITAVHAPMIESFRRVLSDTSASALLASNFLGVVAWQTWVIYIVVFFERQYGLAHGLASTYAIVLGGGMLVGSQLGAMLGNRHGQRIVLAASMTGYGTLLVLVTTLVPALPLAIALCAAGGFLFGLRATSNAALMTEQVPLFRSTVLGLSATTVAGAIATSGALGGMLLDASGFVALALFCLAAAAGSGAIAVARVSEVAPAVVRSPGPDVAAAD